MNYGPGDKEMNGVQTTGSDEFEREPSSRQMQDKFVNMILNSVSPLCLVFVGMFFG